MLLNERGTHGKTKCSRGKGVKKRLGITVLGYQILESI